GEDATAGAEGEDAWLLSQGEDAWLPSQGEDAAPAGPKGEEAAPAAGAVPPQTEPGRAGEPPSGQDLLEELAQGLSTDVVELGDTGAADTDMLSGKLTGFATLAFPGHLGTVSATLRVPFGVTNFSDESLDLTLTSVIHEGRDLLARPVRARIASQEAGGLEAVLHLPSGLQPGEHRLPISVAFADPEVRISPLRGELQLSYAPSAAVGARCAALLSTYWLYLVIAAIVAALVVFLVVFLRSRMADASFAGFYAGGRRGRKRGRPIIMRVQEQNSQIGSRNIHRLPPKSSLSVGGDGSAFLIYFVQMPRRIGVLKNDGKQLVFVPTKTEYFVELTGPLPDCLGKPIRAESIRGYPVVFSFHEYVSPLEEINRLMRSIHHEGTYPLKAKPKGS
ncbi:MAG: hypothetical protein JW820_01030, partial [Spirochaetales bacterium]|nr:hypothetical protein [Spirochaetales bacterium]